MDASLWFSRGWGGTDTGLGTESPKHTEDQTAGQRDEKKQRKRKLKLIM